ncbi:MAG TPA: hypothetical protein ENH91_07970 [Leeuwenhoekiella sp.]|nr:hypothetical protein [Leeuwenhoekiella sp.]
MFFPTLSYSQAYEAEVLTLNFAKYQEMVATVHEVRKGYRILKSGYEKISGVANEDYDLHRAFLDGLKSVSPAVKDYYKVKAIVDKQKLLIKNYKYLYRYIQKSEQFNPDEINILKNIFDNMVSDSLNNLDGLLMVVVASDMNMTDDSRLARINAIYKKMDAQLEFLNSLNDRIIKISIGRQREAQDYELNQNLNTYEGFILED